MPNENTEGTFWVVLVLDVLVVWLELPYNLFLESQVSNVLCNEPTIEFFKQNYEQIPDTSASAYVGRGASGCTDF